MTTIANAVGVLCARHAKLGTDGKNWTVRGEDRELVVRGIQEDGRFAHHCAGRTYIFQLIRKWEARNWGKSRAALR